MKYRFFPLMLWALLLLAGEAHGQETFDDRSSDAKKTETRFRLVEDDQGLTINFDGRLFARYDLYSANKPYLWPIMGPTGKSMTRAFPMEDLKSEGNGQRDHPHHRGILFGHQKIARDSPQKTEDGKSIGGDSWHEKLTYIGAENRDAQVAALATVKHREFKRLDANDDRAVVVEVCDYLDSDGKKFLQEQRRLTFGATDTTRTIDFDQELIASAGDVVFYDRKDAGLSIRVPASMAVKSKQGGQIVNSARETDGEAWSKPARWCDYHGPVEGEHLGIAILNHPSSFRFPTRWHVRQYGLFTANPFGSKAFDKNLEDATLTLKKGESLLLKHRFIFHRGDAADAKIEEAWQQYSKEENDEE